MRTTTTVVVVLSALLGALCAHRVEAAASTRPAKAALRRAHASIDRFAQVAPGIYRGAQPDGEGFAALRRLGVRTVVDLRWDHDERREVLAHGMRPISLPMVGGSGAPAPGDAKLRRFLKIVLDPANQPVFVHCYHGRDRAGAMFAAYRMEVEGWPRDRALREMRARGFDDGHRHLLEFVRTYTRRGWALGPATADGAPDAGPGSEDVSQPAAK